MKKIVLLVVLTFACSNEPSQEAQYELNRKETLQDTSFINALKSKNDSKSHQTLQLLETPYKELLITNSNTQIEEILDALKTSRRMFQKIDSLDAIKTKDTPQQIKAEADSITASIKKLRESVK